MLGLVTWIGRRDGEEQAQQGLVPLTKMAEGATKGQPPAFFVMVQTSTVSPNFTCEGLSEDVKPVPPVVSSATF